jgi:hypothetical protein
MRNVGGLILLLMVVVGKSADDVSEVIFRSAGNSMILLF